MLFSKSCHIVLFLLAFEFENLGEFLPLAVLGHFEGGAFLLFQDIGGIVLHGEGGGEVLRAVIIDQVEAGRIVVLYLGRGDDPAEGVVLLAEIARQHAIQLLSWHLDILIVEIDVQIDIILIIEKVRAKGRAIPLLCKGADSQP